MKEITIEILKSWKDWGTEDHKKLEVVMRHLVENIYEISKKDSEKAFKNLVESVDILFEIVKHVLEKRFPELVKKLEKADRMIPSVIVNVEFLAHLYGNTKKKETYEKFGL